MSRLTNQQCRPTTVTVTPTSTPAIGVLAMVMERAVVAAPPAEKTVRVE
jgi:hypothetical protein